MIAPVVDLTWLTNHPEAVVVDVRWYLDGRSGIEAYANGHLPGAVFVSLDDVLAAEASPEAGRHPLPEPAVFAEGMREAGISNDSLVVAYDDAGGAAAGRLVWLLRMLGVNAALLDGGLQTWDGALAVGMHRASEGNFEARPWSRQLLATIEDAATALTVVDARAPERYRGEVEPIDSRAGHIPGAINLPFAENLTAEGTFKTPDALRARFEAAGITQAEDVVVYCGSGVTACHDLIALEYAGLGRARLYPGSWSQFAATSRPAAQGPQPGTQPPTDAATT